MSPLEHTTVRRKLSAIVENLGLLQPVSESGLAAWMDDRDRRDASKHRLQVCIEAAIDINAHLLVQAGHAAPADAFQSFLDVAQKLDVIRRDLAAKLAPAAGLRNRLVHQYDQLDEELVLAGVAEAVTLLPAYVEAVEAYLLRS